MHNLNETRVHESEAGSRNRESLRKPFTPVAIVVGLFTAALVGCSSDSQSDTDSGKEAGSGFVLVDNRTSDVFVSETKPTGAVAHPKTGKLTLMPGAYCPKCNRWYPLPPMDVLQRSATARNCPVNKTALQADGPIPEDAQQLNP